MVVIRKVFHMLVFQKNKYLHAKQALQQCRNKFRFIKRLPSKYPYSSIFRKYIFEKQKQ
jgi:hypothetical protein